MFIRLSAYEVSILHKAINEYMELHAEGGGLEGGNREVLQGIVEKLYPERRQRRVFLATVIDRTYNTFGLIYYNGPGKNVTVEDETSVRVELDAAENINDALRIVRERCAYPRYVLIWAE